MPAQTLPGLRRRIAALVYETMLLAGVLSVTLMVPHLILGMAFGVTAPPWLVFLNFFGVLGVYFVWYWHQHGQTLAMQTWKLQLVSLAGGRPPLAQLLLRFALAWSIPLLMIFVLQQLLMALPYALPRWYPYLGGLVGILWAFLDRDRQFLHDRLAGTRIEFKFPENLP